MRSSSFRTRTAGVEPDRSPEGEHVLAYAIALETTCVTCLVRHDELAS